MATWDAREGPWSGRGAGRRKKTGRYMGEERPVGHRGPRLECILRFVPHAEERATHLVAGHSENSAPKVLRHEEGRGKQEKKERRVLARGGRNNLPLSGNVGMKESWGGYGRYKSTL